MRRFLIVLMLLMVTLLAAGCNSGISSDVAAKSFIDALFSGNAAGVRDVVCERAKPMVTDESMADIGVTGADTSGLSYSVRDATDTTATVVVSGPLRIGTGETQQEFDFSTFSELSTLPAIVENSAWKICPAGIGTTEG